MSKRRRKGSRKAHRRHSRRSHEAPKRTRRRKGRSSHKRSSKRRRRASAPAARKASAGRSRKRRSGRKHRVKGHYAKRGSKRVHVKGHMSRETPRRKKRRSRKSREAGVGSIPAAAEAPRRKRRRRSRKSREATAAKESPRRRRRSSKRRSSHKRRSSTRRRRASAPRRASAGRSRRRKRSGHRKHSVRGHYAKRGSKRVLVRRHMSHETRRSRERYALENPLTGTEIAVGAVTGVVGFLASDALDRVLATHALTLTGSNGSDGKPTFADTPNTTGKYVGLYNATAVLSPMNGWRWLAGALVTGAPFALAAFVKAPVGRSALQFFGFGAGVRLLSKAGTDLMAKFFGRTSWGARLYDGEARAWALDTGADQANYPTSGLNGIPRHLGLGRNVACGACANCRTGVGACCRLTGSNALPAPAGTPPSQMSAPQQNMAPPSTMVPITPPVVVPAPQPPPAPAPRFSIPGHRVPGPVDIPSSPPATVSSPFSGTGGLPKSGRPSRYGWGNEEDAA